MTKERFCGDKEKNEKQIEFRKLRGTRVALNFQKTIQILVVRFIVYILFTPLGGFVLGLHLPLKIKNKNII